MEKCSESKSRYLDMVGRWWGNCLGSYVFLNNIRGFIKSKVIWFCNLQQISSDSYCTIKNVVFFYMQSREEFKVIESVRRPKLFFNKAFLFNKMAFCNLNMEHGLFKMILSANYFIFFLITLRLFQTLIFYSVNWWKDEVDFFFKKWSVAWDFDN